MSPLLITVAALAAVVTVFRRPVRLGLPLVVGVIVLVPATLVVPNGVSFVPTFHRVVLWSLLAGVVVAVGRDRLPSRTLRLTPVHLLAAVVVVVTLIVGIGVGLPLASFRHAAVSWLRVLDHLVVFVAVAAVVRATPDLRRVRWIIAIAVLLAAGIGVTEHLTRASWGQWLFGDLASQRATDAASSLGVRAGNVRVRGAAEFALEYGWVLVALLPMVTVALGDLRGRWRWTAPFAVALPVAAVFWSYSRTPLWALLPTLAVAAVLVRIRWHAATVGAAIAIAAVTVLAVPAVIAGHDLEVDEGSIDVRSERLPEILEVAAERPFVGMGFGSLEELGYPTTDSSYLLLYAEVGAAGLAVVVVTLLLALVYVARGAFATPSDAQRTAGAAAAGMVALLAGAAAYDTFQVQMSATVFWVLAAVGLVAAERAAAPIRWSPWPWRTRLALPVAGTVLGAVVVLVTPAVHVGNFMFVTLPTELETKRHTQDHIGRRLVGSVCDVVRGTGGTIGGARVDCSAESSAEGVGRLHVVAARADRVPDAIAQLTAGIVDVVGIESFRVYPHAEIVESLPTAARTAPAWLGIAGLGAVLLPVVRREG